MKYAYLLTAFLLISMSCKTNTATVQPSKDVPNVVSETDKPKGENAPVFFTASGADDSWTINMSSQSIILKSSDASDPLSFPYSPPLNATESKLKIFRSRIGTNSIEISVTNLKCDSDINNKNNNYQVLVNFVRNGEVKKLTGCGNFTSDKALNTVWTLHQLNGKPVTPDNFGQELPYIDIHTEIGSFTGFGGCNGMKGSVALHEPGAISFYDVISTKMMCLEGNQENAFMRAFQSANQYQIKNGNLYLSKGKEVVLVLKK